MINFSASLLWNQFKNNECYLLLQEYSVQVTFREQWNDERLRYHDDTHGKKKLNNSQKVLSEIIILMFLVHEDQK